MTLKEFCKNLPRDMYILVEYPNGYNQIRSCRNFLYDKNTEKWKVSSSDKCYGEYNYIVRVY